MIRSHSLRVAAFAAVLFTRAAFCAEAVEEVDDGATSVTGKIRNPGTRVAAPEIAAASDEATQALKRMTLPAGLTATLWAAEPMLANPVAFNFDERGRIYVAETYRYRSSVLDIRDYMWTLEAELANRNGDDWLATIKRSFGAEGVKELSIESERVRLLEDTDHTGVATRSTLFAEGFNGPLDGIASGVIARRGSVWFTNIPTLWRFDGETKDGAAAKRTALSTGYGVRFNFTGHDMHGLIFGPDGKLYFSIGDRGAHATALDGSVADSPDTGSVFRCNPDGTQLERFATGLRNPQSLVFTENGDLFTGDNDCDQGDEERLVHIVQDGDSGWRVGYQFPPRAPESPWLNDKLWQPRTKETAAYLLSPICNIEDGPSGITYYPGTGLNETYRGNFFITHFKGSIARSGIYTYRVKPSGATYAIADAKPFLGSALPTDVKFGPDGRLYTSDWADGWPKSKRGRIYAISDPKHAKDAIIKETQELIGGDWSKRTDNEIAQLLGHADWRVRLEAQFTLAERGAASIAVLTGVAVKTDAVPLARRHAIWGLGQLATKNPAALAPLRPLLRDADAEVRAQSLKVLGDRPIATDADAFIAALKDENNRVKFFAAQSLGKLKQTAAAPALLTALRANDDKDEYLRHACVVALAAGNNLAALNAAITHESRAVRLGVVLAFRRLGRPEIAKFLNDADPFIVRETALAINDVPIAAAFPALAALTEKSLADEAVMLRALNAHFRLGSPANAQALATYAARSDAPAKLRAEAIAQLALWPKPPQRDRLVGIYRPLAEKTRSEAVARDALAKITPGLLAVGTPEPVQTATLAALETLEAGSVANTLFAIIGDRAQSGESRAAALKALDKLKDKRLADAVKLAGDSDSPALRLAALPIASRLSPAAAAPVLANLIARGTIAEQKTAFRALGTLKHPSADTILAEQLKKLAAGEVKPAVQLELTDAAARRPDPAVKKLLADGEAALAQNPDPLARYRFALEGGDATRGQRIFTGQAVMPCIRCHRVGTESGGEAGPNLAGTGAAHTREYLLESVVKPNAKIAPGFDTVLVTLKAGGVEVGIVAGEDAETLSLRNTENKVVTVKKSAIAKREGAPSSMPEIYATILKKYELRDIVEYLASLTSKSDSKPSDSLPRALRGLAAKASE